MSRAANIDRHMQGRPAGSVAGCRSCFLLVCIAAMLAYGADARADGDGECEAPFVGWLAACQAHAGVALHVDHCTDGVAVVRAQADGDEVRVQISRGARGAFAQVGPFGLDPVANYPDWSQAPPGVRRGFDAVRACTTARAPPLSRAAVTVRGALHGPVPWRTWFALATFGAWLALLCAAPRRGTRVAEGTLALGGAVLVTLLRHVAMAPAFFHQNGQGPGWIQFALCQQSPYGPGYASLFHRVAVAAGAHGERGVFALDEVLAALSAVAVYASARGLGVSRRTSVGLVFATGLLPLIVRLARSESYYAVSLWLLVMALSALLVSGPRARPERVGTWVGALVAGAFLALAVLVHPVAWIPAACVPAGVLLRTGSRRARAAVALGSAALVGGTVVVVALGDVRTILHGALGHQWGGSIPGRARLWSLALTLAAPWILGLALPRRVARWIVPVLLVVLAVRCDALVNFLPADPTHAPTEAWRMLFRVVALGGGIACLARVEWLLRRRMRFATTWMAMALLLVAGTYTARTFRRWTTLPTDALEEQAVATELAALPVGVRVHYLGRSGRMLQELPCYAWCGVPGPDVAMHEATEQPPQLAPGEYWLRAAPCSTTEGRPFCAAVERGLVLRALSRHRWPARPSLPYAPYDATVVDTGLFRVEGAR